MKTFRYTVDSAASMNMARHDLSPQPSEYNVSSRMEQSTWTSVIELLRIQAKKQPDSIVLSYGIDQVTYRELDLLSSTLAIRLVEQGVAAKDFVVVLCRRDLELVILLLAVLKTGACYVPVDIDAFSKDHVLDTITTVQPRLVISAYESQYDGWNTYIWTRPSRRDLKDETYLFVAHIQPSDLAYTIFTSGTTSKAKGVMVSHSAIANYVQQGNADAPFNLSCTPNDVVMLLFSPAFDASTGVIFSTICNGGHLRVTNPEMMVHDLGICTILPATPSMLAAISRPAAFPNIRAVFLGGESPTHTIVATWESPSRRIWNCYGPTETTCTSLIAEIFSDQRIVLGRPMAGSKVVLLSSNPELSDEGEICISGPGLARGYFKNAEMTNEKFFERDAQRFYRTGDFARRTSEGLVFIGRQDALVKHRGFLINLETQIVPMLCNTPGVESAVAFLHGDTLVSFTTPSNPNGKSIRSQLAGRHDSFLIPDKIIALEAFPINRNGKIDVRGLSQSIDDCVSNDECFNPMPPRLPISLLKEAIGKVLSLQVSAISNDSSFWHLGGSSIWAVALLSELRCHGLSVPFGDLLGNRTVEQLELLLTPFEEEGEKFVAIESESFSTTLLQNHLIVGTMKNPSTNFMLIDIEFEHRADATVGSLLQQAWKKVLSRHLIFHVVFSANGSTQHIKKGVLDLDWQEMTAGGDTIESILRDQRRSLVDLSQSNPLDPPTAFRLVTIPNDRSVMLWLVHHARVDGWSVHLLLDELRRILDGEELFRAPQFLSLIEPPMSCTPKAMADYPKPRTINQLKAISGTSFKVPFQGLAGKRSWCHSGIITLPTLFQISDLEARAHEMGVSSGTVLYCAWSLLLTNYTGSQSTSFATVFSGRNRGVPGIERMVGPLLLVVPLSICTAGVNLKSRWLESVQEAIEKIGNTTELQLDYHSGFHDRSSLPDSLVVLQYGLPKPSECRRLPLPWKYNVSQTTDFMWTLLVEENDGYVSFKLVYDTLTISSQVSERALEHLVSLLGVVLRPEDPSITSMKQQMMGFPERSALTLYKASLNYDYSGPQTLKTAFEIVADQYPFEIAIETSRSCVTYQQLDVITNVIAHKLLPQCSRDEGIVIISDGSADWIFSILAVLKIGCFYCPIDIASPLERIKFMINSCQAKIILCPASHCQILASIGVVHDVVIVDSTLHDPDSISRRLPDRSGPHDTAFMSFTSGTTGRPKAVRTRHVALLSYLSFPPARVQAGPGVKMAQTFSCGFDACAAEIFGALCYGATLVLKDPFDLVANIRRSTSAIITPSFLSALVPADFPDLRTIMSGGEALPQSLVDAWSPGRTMYNGYGPCECSIACLVSQVSKGKPVTLGRSVPSMSVYILNDEMHPVPMGIAGQLYVSGIQVSGEYASSEDTDASRFSPDPFKEGYTMFHTGDVGRWTEDMEVEFLGRLDRHVKVRGYQVSLEEIENVIRQSSSEISQAAVVLSEQTLIAYISPIVTDLQAIEGALASILPAYSRPTRIYTCLQLPQTISQKIDYHALDSLQDCIDLTSSALTLPNDTLSIMVADAWRAALPLNSIAGKGPYMESNFFALGGHSLLLVSVARNLSRCIGREVPLKTLVTSSTLSEMINAIRSEHTLQHVSWGPFINFENDRDFLSSDISTHERQMLWWSRRLGSSAAFNCPLLLTIAGDLNQCQLIHSLQTVLKATRVLRSRFHFKDSNVWRSISKPAHPISVRKITGPVDSLLDEEVNRPFDLEKDQLIRLTLIKAQDKLAYLLINAHHAIVDGSTMQAFCQHIASHYQAGLVGNVPRSPSSKSTIRDLDYLDWIRWTNLLPSSRFSPQSKFWPTYLQGVKPLFSMSEIPSTAGGSSLITRRFSKDQTTRIMQCCDDNGVSLQELLTACAALAINAVYGIEDVVAAIPYSNRTEPGTETLMGCFLDSVQVRLALTAHNLSSSRSTLSEVHSSTSLAVSNYLPCGDVQDLVGAGSPQFDVVISVFPLTSCFTCDLPGCTTTIRPLKTGASKFPLMFEVFFNHEEIIIYLEHQQSVVSKSRATRLDHKFMQALDWFHSGVGVWNFIE